MENNDLTAEPRSHSSSDDPPPNAGYGHEGDEATTGPDPEHPKPPVDHTPPEEA
jgi:hypothetical protein